MATAKKTQGKRRALLIVDVQEDFVEGGSLGVDGGRELAERIAVDLLPSDCPYDLIVTTQDWHIDPGTHFSDQPDFVSSWPVHCVAGSSGAEILPAITDALKLISTPHDRILKGQYEDAYSGFMGANGYGDTLAQVLNESDIERVDVVGIASDHCVAATARDSAAEGFRTRVLKDYTVGIDSKRIDAIYDVELPGLGIKVA